MSLDPGATGPSQAELAQLYRVSVVQTSTWSFWVKAPNRDAAEDDAQALAETADRSDWQDVDLDVDVTHAPRITRRPVPGDSVWVGGEDGTWEFVT